MPLRGTDKGRFEKGTWLRMLMQDIRRPVLMLFLLVLTSLGPVLQSETSPQLQTPLDEGILPSQSERLELATTLWGSIEPIPLTEIELRPSSGIIRIQAGEFDPLLSDGPALDAHFVDFNDPVQTAFAFLQLHEHDGNILEQLMKDYSFTPLDFIADEGWLIRLPSPPLSSLEVDFSNILLRCLK